MSYVPPYTITPNILRLSLDIAHELGLLAGAKLDQSPIKLRRQNRIRTIQASLAIEGNTLSIDQVTDIFEGKRVLGPIGDILEVKNAIEVYKSLTTFDPLSMTDFLMAHKVLMHDLTGLNGKWRTGNVGVFKGEQVVHMAPSAKMVPGLMENLFGYISHDLDVPWLIKACIFHYELEFIHPFSDGNGRMGRLWQQLLLMKVDPLFEYIPVEILVKAYQDRYYAVLSECDKAGDSTQFIDFSLELILDSLKNYSDTAKPNARSPSSRLAYMRNKFSSKWFSRKDYMKIHHDISPATASRDLSIGVKDDLLIKKGSINQTRYKFKE